MTTMIQPERISIEDIRIAVDDGLMATVSVVDSHIRGLVLGWDPQNMPNWKTVGPKTVQGNRRVDRQTGSVPFCWVDQGTAGPYPIPKNPKPPGEFLVFQSGFTPKTKPGSLASGVGGSFGPTIFAKQVMHPGIKEPRDFVGESAKRISDGDILVNNIQAALNRVRTL